MTQEQINVSLFDEVKKLQLENAELKEALDTANRSADEQMRYKQEALQALQAVREWYERDGSVGGCATVISDMVDPLTTPETDALVGSAEGWNSFKQDIIALARNMERKLHLALKREAAIIHFCECELSWELFRAELELSDNPTISMKNAMKLREFLSANAEAIHGEKGVTK